MHKLLSAVLFIFAAACSVSAQSAPVLITQTIRLVDINHYGIEDNLFYTGPTAGDWIIKTTIDSEALPFRNVFNLFTEYQLEKVTLTQAALGIEDVVITNMNILNLHTSGFQFVTNPVPAGNVSTQVGYFSNPRLTLQSAPTLQEFFALLQDPQVSYAAIAPSSIGFELANGSKIFGTGLGYGFATISAVPEASNYAMLMLGLFVLAWVRQQRNKSNAS